MSVMCDRDSHVLLCVPGMWSATDLYREILGTTKVPMSRVMPGAHKTKPTMVRQHRKRMMRRRTFLKKTTWTRKDTRPATCLRKKMAVGNTATTT